MGIVELTGLKYNVLLLPSKGLSGKKILTVHEFLWLALILTLINLDQIIGYHIIAQQINQCFFIAKSKTNVWQNETRCLCHLFITRV